MLHQKHENHDYFNDNNNQISAIIKQLQYINFHP